MRRKDRELRDPEQILALLQEAKICRVALNDGGVPYIVPMHYGFELTEGRLRLYLHSAREGHKLDLLRQDPRVGIELDRPGEITSGGEVPCRYGALFRSLIGRGTLRVVTDPDEQRLGLRLLMEEQTGRRFDIDESMAASVCVLCAEVETYSVKGRLN